MLAFRLNQEPENNLDFSPVNHKRPEKPRFKFGKDEYSYGVDDSFINKKYEGFKILNQKNPNKPIVAKVINKFW